MEAGTCEVAVAAANVADTVCSQGMQARATPTHPTPPGGPSALECTLIVPTPTQSYSLRLQPEPSHLTTATLLQPQTTTGARPSHHCNPATASDHNRSPATSPLQPCYSLRLQPEPGHLTTATLLQPQTTTGARPSHHCNPATASDYNWSPAIALLQPGYLTSANPL